MEERHRLGFCWLSWLQSRTDRAKPFPNGMIQLLVRTDKGAQNYSWSQLRACLARSLNVQDTTASVFQILEELLPPTDQSEMGTSSPPQTVHLGMDPSCPERIRCSGSGVQKWRAILRE